MKHFFSTYLSWPVVCIVLGVILAVYWFMGTDAPEPDVPDPLPVAVEPVVVVHPGQVLGYPTPQTHLVETNNPAVFMPTASGRVVSAGYGSVRTRKFGKRYLAAFHEGVDIAPVARDSRGRALDPVFAVADGRVEYVSRRAGNSSYGTYVVLLHEDRAGDYFTLYAHLASVPKELQKGGRVVRGEEIGRMGHSSTLGIPVQRSHLHFEFGTILNDRFAQWLRSKEMTPTHGRAHGYNLVGLNPTELFPYMADGSSFFFEDCLAGAPVAFRLLVGANTTPD
jgi:murein DD-endopeptidase MepM/ murein hydrolase activator NlpD